MTNPANKFTLREMRPSDSGAVEKLISTFEDNLVTFFSVDAYTAIVSGNHFETTAVVVEVEGHKDLIGMGTLRFGNIQFNGDVLPLAFLDGLKVDPNFRRQGLGFKIANWRVQKARERFGDKGVLGTAMAITNAASRAVAKKWCREFIDLAIEVAVLPARTKAPKLMPGITVREIGSKEYESFAAAQNSFYKDYNFYEPYDAEMIKSNLDLNIDGKKIYRFYGAFDVNGNLQAGAQVWVRGVTKYDELANPPLPLRLMNGILHFFPPDFKARGATVSNLWYSKDNEHIGSYLWEMIRWLANDIGTTFIIAFDPNDPAKKIIKLKPWNQPRPKVTLAVNGPQPIDRNRLICPVTRV